MKDGYGQQVWQDGSKYDGQWRNGCRDGQGKCTYPTVHGDTASGVYTGKWRRDKREGSGKFEFTNGDEYEGQWHGDLRHGKGICRYRSGEVYDGDWRDDVRCGSGGEKGPLSKLDSNSLYELHKPANK